MTPTNHTGDLPQDRRVDRRSFLERLSALIAATAMGEAAFPSMAAGGVAPFRSRFAPVGPGRSLPPVSAIRETDPWEMTVAELASLLRTGELAPVELVQGYLDRIGAFDPMLKAFNTVTAEQALREARRAEALPWAGPLHGIPLAVKDNYYTAGVVTTANSHIFAEFVPEFDATCWARLKDAGAILLGKTQMGPLATSRATTPDGENTTRNAWAPEDPDVSPGGSSSGSATAVAARLAPSATGTQTGGSITNPSGRQALTGIKPTMGRASLHGIIPLTYTRDHPGPLARDARDAALMLQAMAGPDPMDPRTLGAPPVPDFAAATGDGVGLRWPTTIGVLPGYLEAGRGAWSFRGFRWRQGETPEERERRRELARARGEAEITARRKMLDTFSALGARVVEVEYPSEWEKLTSFNFNNVRLPERSEAFLKYLRRDVRLFGVSLSPWVNGLLLPGAEFLRGQRARVHLLVRILEEIFDRCDVVVQTSPIPFDMVGLPPITFPIGFEETRGIPLPIPALLGGMPWGEERLLNLAAAYQVVTDWHRRAPAPLPEGEAPRPAGRTDVLDVYLEGE